VTNLSMLFSKLSFLSSALAASLVKKFPSAPTRIQCKMVH
jgi:hypothetical protein